MNKYFLREYGFNGVVKLLARYSYKEIRPDTVAYHDVHFLNYDDSSLVNRTFNHRKTEKLKEKIKEFEAEDDESAKLIAECME